MQGVVSRAAFRRQPRSGQKTFTVVSLHTNNNCAKSVESGRSSSLKFVPLCKMSTWIWLLVISTEQDGANQAVSTLNRPVLLRKHLPTPFLPIPPSPTPLWGPGATPGECGGVCGFIVPPNSHDLWKARLHGAFTIPLALQGHEHLTCLEAFQTLSSVFPLLVASFKSSRGCHMSTQ